MFSPLCWIERNVIFRFSTPSICNTPKIMEAFRGGGGIPYGDIGEEISPPWSVFFRRGCMHFLAKDLLGTVPGRIGKLERGAEIAHIGCGRGQSAVAMAKAYPKSKVLGVDNHASSIERATKVAAGMGLGNVSIVRAAAHEGVQGRKFDLICRFDCIHDMVNSKATVRAIRDALNDDGVYIWSEPNASASAHENRNPVGKAFHAICPLHCMTVSLAFNGAGVGTAIGETGARALPKEAGFSKFERLLIQNPFNQSFALRK